MKKTVVVLLLLAVAFVSARALAAPSETEAASAARAVIAYFSVPETDGVDAVSGASRVVARGKVVGNTEFNAQTIQSTIGGDLFAIETTRRYPGSHAPLVEFADRERRANARPELSSRVDPKGYGVIFLGYPNWYADMPMPLYTFLETHDFSGMTIVPFVTHGGSGSSRTVDAIRRLQPNASVVTDILTLERHSVPSAERDVKKWLAGLKIPL